MRSNPFSGIKSDSRLTPLPAPAHNPGNLLSYGYVPEGLPKSAPLVVVLHGCTQDARGYDRGSGWSQLAERNGFALLFPEQQRSNSPMNCFNWFTANDSQRGMGEAASIKAMVDQMVKAHDLDPRRIFVTGLSAGGAMTSVMLATYPETFAGGGIIAGVAYGCASDMTQAFDCMGGRAQQAAAELAAKVRRASPHKGRWPKISVWHGTSDGIVAPANADSIVRQWTHLHGLAAEPGLVDTVEGYPHKVWLDAEGKPIVEEYLITGMSHGTPLMPGTGEGESGEAGAHMLDAAISSTDRLAAFWGIAPAVAEQREARPATIVATPTPTPTLQPLPRASRTHRRRMPAQVSSIQKTIEDALRAAGLMGR